MKKRISSLFVFLLLTITAAAFLAQNRSVSAQGQEKMVPHEILVKFKDDVDPREIGSIHREMGDTVTHTIAGINVQVVSVDKNVTEAVSAYARNRRVEYAEPNALAELLEVIPADLYFGNQWVLHNSGQVFDIERNLSGSDDADIDAPEAWGITEGSAAVYIAILDSGINLTHPDLVEKLAPSRMRDFSGSGLEDQSGHATHVAGIAGASTNNGVGVAGVGFNSNLMIGKVCNNSGSCPYSWIADGVVWAADNGASVISMSLGGSFKSKTLESAVNYAWNTKNAVLVAAAGNSNNPSKTYPGAYTNIIAVAATDAGDHKASFSSYGSWVDVAAPGVEVFSTFPNHPFALENPAANRDQNYGYGSGTSMSTPVVAGIAGLVWSTPLAENSNAKVRAQVEKTADSITGTGTYWTWGRVNAYQAVTVDVQPSDGETGGNGGKCTTPPCGKGKSN